MMRNVYGVPGKKDVPDCRVVSGRGWRAGACAESDTSVDLRSGTVVPGCGRQDYDSGIGIGRGLSCLFSDTGVGAGFIRKPVERSRIHIRIRADIVGRAPAEGSGELFGRRNEKAAVHPDVRRACVRKPRRLFRQFLELVLDAEQLEGEHHERYTCYQERYAYPYHDGCDAEQWLEEYHQRADDE